MTKLSSGPVQTGGVEYEDLDQLDASKDVTAESLAGQVQHSSGTGVPPPLPGTRSQSSEEYEVMDQHSASINGTGGRNHHSQTWGLPPPSSLLIKGNVEPQCEDLTQYNASKGVAMVANPSYDTKDS